MSPEPQVATSNEQGAAETPHCRLCNEPLVSRLRVPRDWRRPEPAGPYDMMWCDSCQLGTIHPMLTAAEIAKAYEVDAYYTHALDQQEDGDPLLDQLRFKLACKLDRAVPLSLEWFGRRYGDGRLYVCEIGCGDGALLLDLQREGHIVTGVEPDPSARSVAEGNALGLRVSVGTAEELPDDVTSRRFDVVVMNHVLEHTVDPIAAVSNALGLLAPGGVLVIETPNHRALGFQRAGATWAFLDVPRHLHFFTEASLRKTCAAAGAKVQEVEYHGYCRQLKQSWVKTERTIWDALNGGRATPPLQRNSSAEAWRLLLRTAVSSRPEKCDSVRVLASPV